MHKWQIVFYLVLSVYAFYVLFFRGGTLVVAFAILLIYSLVRDLPKKDPWNDSRSPFFRKDNNDRL